MRFIGILLLLISCGSHQLDEPSGKDTVVIHDYLRKDFWLEDFIELIISERYNTLFLSEENWNQIRTAIFDSYALIITPFKNKQISFQ